MISNNDNKTTQGKMEQAVAIKIALKAPLICEKCSDEKIKIWVDRNHIKWTHVCLKLVCLSSNVSS